MVVEPIKVQTVLILSARYPWPLIGGDRVKMYYILSHLAKHHRVILVAFCHGKAATSEQLEQIKKLGVEVHPITLHPILAGLASIRSLWTKLPLEIAFYTRSAFQRKVDAILQTENVDVAIAFFMRTAEYIRNNPTVRKILIAEDCRVIYQKRSATSVRSPLQKLVRWWELLKLRPYERDVVGDFETTTLVSKQDLVAMKSGNPDAHYAVVTNGVNIEHYGFQENQHERHGLLFAGKLDVQSNHLIAMTIVRDIMPKVLKAMPEAQVSIVGAKPKPELLKFRSASCTICENVPDMVPYLQTAAVFVHPHLGGSGIQNKILEAMATGCVVVTSTTGLQGINAIHNVHCLVGINDEEISQYVVQLLNDAPLRERLARAARKLIEDEHQWNHVGNQLDSVLQGSEQPVIIRAHEGALS